MDNAQFEAILKTGESLTVEFKSDLKGLPDRDFVLAVVALANTEGGWLLLGVEDDGTLTGLSTKHDDIVGMTALIANKTNPSLTVEITRMEYEQKTVACVHVPKSRNLVSSTDGTLQRRRLKSDGSPEAIPLLQHEIVQRQTTLMQMDVTASPIMSVPTEVLSPIERVRIREAIRRYGGDSSLLPLSDDELDGALGLVTVVEGVRRPTLAGLILLGREETLRINVPTHEVAFQVMDGTIVRMNEFFRKPLLQVFEEIEQLFNARIEEEEVDFGLFRVPVPNYDRRGFREALVNALVHRDYSRLGTVYIRFGSDGLTISNPGGFVEGVTLQNLLVTEPRYRNPLLADIVKRIGLAERTGRGIDRIYEGVLRYGRPAPDYSRSDATIVVLRLLNADANTSFLRLILEHDEKTGRAMPIDSLLILSRLREERRLATSDLALSIQKSEQETRKTLERLVEEGLLEHHGSGRGRTYTLSATLYQQLGRKAAYVRQAGFDPIQQEQMVMSFINSHREIRRSDVMELCHLNKDQAYRLLVRMKKNGLLKQLSDKRQASYIRRVE